MNGFGHCRVLMMICRFLWEGGWALVLVSDDDHI
jgi:hypothetical protein